MQIAPIYLSLALLTSSWVGAQTLQFNEDNSHLGLKIPASFRVQQISSGRIWDVLDPSVVSNMQESIVLPDILTENLIYLGKLYQNPCLELSSLSQKANCQIQTKSSHHLLNMSDTQLIRQKRNEFNWWMASKIGGIVMVSEPNKKDGIGRLTLFHNWRLQLKSSDFKMKYERQF